VKALESEDEGKYVDWCKTEKIICEKVKFVRAGYPDRLSILPDGRHVWIEFKRRGEELDPRSLQPFRIKQLRAQGACAGWTDDSRIAILAVKALMDATRVSKAGDPFASIPISRRVILRSWFGEDLNLFSCLENLKGQGFCFQDSYYRALAADVQGVAR
jgi:hypothetical protein